MKKANLLRRLEEYIEFATKTKRFADVAFYEDLHEYISASMSVIENIDILGNEFDRMHRMIHSRYVAERIFDTNKCMQDDI